MEHELTTTPEALLPDEALTVTEEGPEAGTAEAGPAGEEAGSAPERPREQIKGIHPELLCTCPECEPHHVELQWFTVDEARKVKGDAMLFCALSSRKYFSPVQALQDWLNAKGGPRKGRRNEG
ncbi:MAG: hypothetical protein VKP62_02620 [Candidatus Sericytochromatia bacterium]|nr:hypothetical protein [Candidatus Sericytochromatia bacterium]